MKVSITLEGGQLPHVVVTDGPMERAYDTTPDILAELFTDADDGPSTWTASPLLPPQTVFWAQRSNGEQVLVLDCPAGPQPWIVQSRNGAQEVHVIPLPRLLFWFQHRNQRVVRTALVAVADDAPLTPETPLFAYPLSNVYQNTTCCWHLPDERIPLDALPGLARAFLSTPNNWDLYTHGNQSGLDYRGLIAALDQQPTFPHAWLRPLAWTWETWITYLIPHLTPDDPPPIEEE